jgi:hypothetical protein
MEDKEELTEIYDGEGTKEEQNLKIKDWLQVLASKKANYM